MLFYRNSSHSLTPINIENFFARTLAKVGDILFVNHVGGPGHEEKKYIPMHARLDRHSSVGMATNIQLPAAHSFSFMRETVGFCDARLQVGSECDCA